MMNYCFNVSASNTELADSCGIADASGQFQGFLVTFGYVLLAELLFA
ncbi:hypothetical protein [Serratia fonticola]|nr:hypothetical protein [Serratia fonticola]MBL5901915.1 hypothetical protein [Serratia fonticola]